MNSVVMKLLLSFALVAFIAPESFAQGIKRTEKKIDLEVRKREKSDEKPGLDGKPRVNQAQIIASQVEGRLIKGIKKTVAQMKRIISTLPKKSARRLQLMEKMLNLNLENAAYVSSKEQKTYDEEWSEWDSNGRRGREPRLRTGNSKSLWQRVVSLSNQILKEYPKSPNADVVNFTNGLALQFLGRSKQAARSFTQLIQKYPNSKSAGDAYFALGDYYFEKTDFRNAKTNYLSSLKYKRSSRYGWALFKLGWCHYNLGAYRQALRSWKQTVTYSRRGGKGAAVLKDEALRDMVYAFAELGQIEPAIAYFNANGGRSYVGKFLKLLAVTLVDQGKFAKGIKAYKRLQSASPFADEAPEAQSEIISLHYELGNFKSVWRELSSFPRKYGKGSPWARRKGRRAAIESQKMIKDQMLYYSKLSHKKGQERKSKAMMVQARQGYMLFLQTFPRSSQSVEVKFNLADIEYFRKRYSEAGKYYLQIAMLKKNKAVIVDQNGKPVRNVHRDSSSFMLDAYYKAYEPTLKKLLKQKPNLKRPKKRLSKDATNFIKACGQYVKMYPADKRVKKNCDVYTAEIFYRHNDRKNALKYMWNVALKYPSSKEGKSAVESIIPLYKNDKKGLQAATAKLLKIPQYARGKTGKKLRGLQIGVEEEVIAAEKNELKKARGFMSLAKKNPKSENAYKYYFNAAGAFIKAGAIPDSLKAYAVLVKRYPKAPVAEESLLQMAKISEKRLSFGEAISHFNKYAIKYPKSKEAGGAAQKVCDLTIAVAPERAFTNCKRLEAYSKDAYIGSLDSLILSLYAMKRYDLMNKVIVQYLKYPGLSPNQKIAATYKRYVASGKRGTRANNYANQILGMYNQSQTQVSGNSLRYVTEIIFRKVNPVIGKFLKIRLAGGDVGKMQASIEKKSVALNEIEQQYSQVTATKDAYWGAAAYHQVGIAYEQFGDLLSNPPGIKGAKPEDVKKQLAPLAGQAYDKAKEFYRNGFQTARKFGVYSEYTAKLTTAIARRSGSKLTFSDWVLMPDFIGGEVSSRVRSRVQ
jgi:TolA-binding protein